MKGYIGSEESEKETEPRLLMRRSGQEGTKKVAYWRHLKGGQEYTVKVYLHYDGGGPTPVAELKGPIDDGQEGLVNVQARFREQ